MSWEFANQTVAPGDTLFSSMVIECPHDRIEVPLFAVAGAAPGPVLCLVSGEHGTEVVGPEAIRRLVEGLDPGSLRGAVVGVPVCNPLAMRTKQHSFPWEKAVWFDPLNDLSSAWPGAPDGTPAECIADHVWRGVVTRADAVLSLHDTNFRPYMGYYTGRDDGRRLCLDYGRIALICEQERPGGLVQHVARDLGKPGALVEWPPLRHVNHLAVEQNLLGLHNVMRSLGMLDGDPRRISDQYVVDYNHADWHRVSAVDDGILVREQPWGAAVRQGDVIARLYDLYRYREVQCVRSPVDGILSDTGPYPCNLSTFFMHQDTTVKGQCVASVFRYDEHVANPGGDPWRHTLMGGPATAEQTPFQ